jgi:hypothetical protein
MAEAHVTVKLSIALLPNGQCRARIDDSPAGASRGPGNDFPLPPRPAEGYPKFLKECGAGTRSLSELKGLGQRLYAAVFAGAVGDAIGRASTLAQSQGAYLRLAISTQSPELLELPWEYLHSDTGYFLQQPKTHIVRVIDELPQQMAPFRPFIRILVAVANPADMARFNADEHLERIRTILGSMGVGIVEVTAATYETLLGAIETEEFDAFYFLGHGQLNPESGGEIFVEDELKSAPMPATVLAQRLSQARKRVYFAYFNSCDTGTAHGTSTFAGVAQRILAHGRIPAVLAQQAPVKANESMRIAEAVLRRIREGQSPEAAVAFARSAAQGTTWGIPVLYTHLRGPEEFERNRIACLLGAEIGASQHGIVLSSFGMGVLLDGQGEMVALERGRYQLPTSPEPISVTVYPPKTYVYPGDTHAQDDVGAAGDVQKLLMRIAQPDQIGFYPSTKEGRDITHWFLFGSRSNKLVATYLKQHSPRFDFRYGEDEWTLDELNEKKEVVKSHKVVAPHLLGKRDYDEVDDFGIIERVTDQEHSRVYIIIAGLGSRATRGCGWYLARHWDELLKKAGGSDFGAVIRCPGGLPHTDATLLHVRVGI